MVEMQRLLQLTPMMGVLVAQVVVEEAQANVAQVVQEILLQQVRLKDLMVVMQYHLLRLPIMELVGVADLLKQVLMGLLLLVAEEVLVQQLVFQQVL
jgi:hypothetical protein